MKTPLRTKLGFGLVLAALPWVGACSPQSSNAPTNLVTAAQAEPASPATNATTPAVVETTPTDLPAKPAPAPDADKLKLPENIKPSAALNDVIKMAQAGVDESVMLTYVTNSQHLFKLGADEIIYLKDIGVPDNVVTAMLERDQALSQALQAAAQAKAAEAQTAQAQAAAAAQAAAQTPAPEAAAPSYVNPPAAQPTETVSQPNVTYNYNYFYNALAPYGSWIEVDGYGTCWRPTVVVIEHDWRPYCHRGRWIYTNLGWYWHSDYSWGWIAFHYGRWFHHPRWGWCWYPDYVWAPSWVVWRYSPGYCGWAPLPPTAWYQPGFGFYYHGSSVGIGFDFGISSTWYTFVSWNRFCDSRPWHHRLPHSRVTQIINNTTIVNNIVTGDNNTIINRGVPVDFVRRHAGTEVRQVAVRALNESRPTSAGRGEWLEQNGRTLTVRRLALPETTAAIAAPAARLRDGTRAHPAGTETKGATALESPARTRLAEAAPRRAADTAVTAPPRPGDERPDIRTHSRETPATRTITPAAKSPARDTAPARVHPEPTPPERPEVANRSAPRTQPLILRGEERSARTPTIEARPQPTPAASPSEQPANENVAPARKAPANSVVVIGRRDAEHSSSRSVSETRMPTLARNDPSRTTHIWTPRSSGDSAPGAAPPRTESLRTATPRVETVRPTAPQAAAPPAFSRPSSPVPRIEHAEPSRVVTPSVPSTPRFERLESPRIQMSAPPAPAPGPSRSFSAPAPVSPAPRAPSVAPSHSAPSLGPAPSRPAPSFTPAPSAPSFSAPAPSRPAPSFDSGAPGRGGGDGAGRRVREF